MNSPFIVDAPSDSSAVTDGDALSLAALSENINQCGIKRGVEIQSAALTCCGHSSRSHRRTFIMSHRSKFVSVRLFRGVTYQNNLSLITVVSVLLHAFS